MSYMSLRAPEELISKIAETRRLVGKSFNSSQVARRAMAIGLEALQKNPNLMVEVPR